MKYIGILFLLGTLLMTSSCDCDESDEDYLLFGHFFGECFGEGCVEIFKLDNESLSEDSNDHYPNLNGLYDGDFTQLTKEKYDLVKDIMEALPQELIDSESQVYGQPDAGDWGGVYVEYKKGDKVTNWLLDMSQDNNPDFVNPFVDVVVEKILLINE